MSSLPTLQQHSNGERQNSSLLYRENWYTLWPFFLSSQCRLTIACWSYSDKFYSYITRRCTCNMAYCFGCFSLLTKKNTCYAGDRDQFRDRLTKRAPMRLDMTTYKTNACDISATTIGVPRMLQWRAFIGVDPQIFKRGPSRGSGDGSPSVGSRGKAPVGSQWSPQEAKAKCEIRVRFFMYKIWDLLSTSRAWTVFSESTQFQKIPKIQWEDLNS